MKGEYLLICKKCKVKFKDTMPVDLCEYCLMNRVTHEPARMIKREIDSWLDDSPMVAEYLNDGWEPYAVTGTGNNTTIHFRRQIPQEE
jgi:hypothetical protein